ncbi:MAG: hypothetical protein HQM16_02260 [Deltaproteobacteria bacterium]|nr:hypothetical protein [Deltaproteobacteria bacterium]
MTRHMTTLFISVIFVLMVAVGFLAMRVSELGSLYEAHVHAKPAGTMVDAEELFGGLTALEKEIKAQKEVLSGLSVSLTNLSDRMNDKTANGAGFMRAPEYSVTAPIYFVKEAGSALISVTGDKSRLTQWIENNEIFLEHVMKKSMPLEYDRRTGGVVVEGLVSDSVFYQMGIRDGDKILTVNGRRMAKGMDLRNELVNQKPARIAIIRDHKRMQIEITYKDKIDDLFNKMNKKENNEIVLDITKEQFNEVLDQQMSKIKTEPALVNGETPGVKILGIDEVSVFSLMEFKAYDIITKIDGAPVSDSKLASVLENADDPIEIDFVRENQSDKVLVRFSRD